MTTPATNPSIAPPEEVSLGYWQEVWGRFRRRKLAMIAVCFVGFLFAVAILAPLIVGTKPVVCRYKGKLYFPAMAYYNENWHNADFDKEGFRKRFSPTTMKKKDPESWAIWPLVYQDPYRRVRANEWPEQPANPTQNKGRPNRYNLFGTTQQGFDVFAIMVHGTLTALLVGFVSMGIAATIGITVGALAGYFGGWIDILLSRLIELVMCIPTLVLILALIAIVEKTTVWHIMVVIGATSWTGIARLARGEFMKLRGSEYVTAARALGATNIRLMFRHMLPNALAPLLVPISFGIASAILVESSLSFLGFGPASSPSWGSLLNAGRSNLRLWWLVVFPGAAIFLTVLTYNLIGEGLQEATDPRLRGGKH